MTFPSSKQLLKQLLPGLLVLVLTVVAIKACLPERTSFAVDSVTNQERQLVIVPTDGVPSAMLNELRTRLEEQHKFGVLMTVQSPMPINTEIGNSNQHDIQKLFAFYSTIERAIKLINKGIGLSRYKFALSTNPKNVMYAPVMSVQDLDSIGNWYVTDEKQRENY